MYLVVRASPNHRPSQTYVRRRSGCPQARSKVNRKSADNRPNKLSSFTDEATK